MTRRDRAALCLALECLRWHVLGEEAEEAIGSAEQALTLPLWAPADAFPNAVRLEVVRARDRIDTLFDHRSMRLLRARLALYLRALLRAEAGDCGPWKCRECHRPLPLHHYPGARRHRCLSCRAPYERRMRPLWESAPPTDGGGG